MDASLVVSIVALVVSVILGILSCIVAIRYGDVAAVKASRKLHEEDVRRARLTALRSLLNEVERIRKLTKHNSQLDPDQLSQRMTKLPVSAFEIAFVSGALVSVTRQELLDAVADYLACTDSVVGLIDIYVAGTPSGEKVAKQRIRAAARRVKEICTSEVPQILDRLSVLLQEEIQQAEINA